MTPEKYLRLLRGAGVAESLPILEQDREAARLLKINKRTARRYRRGEVIIPGPVAVALRYIRRARKS